jgi:hypothetical protein
MGRAGFGIDFGWPFALSSRSDDDKSDASSQTSFYKAASSILNNWIPLAFLPKICLRPFPLTTAFKNAVEGHEVFERELRQVVAKRIEEVKVNGKDANDDKCDILTLLCRANVLEDAKSKLSYEELCELYPPDLPHNLRSLTISITSQIVSDAFVFLIAGHGQNLFLPLLYFAIEAYPDFSPLRLKLQRLLPEPSLLSSLSSLSTLPIKTPSSKKSQLTSNPDLSFRTLPLTASSP